MEIYFKALKDLKDKGNTSDQSRIIPVENIIPKVFFLC